MAAKNTIFSTKTTVNCRGRILDLAVPVVMGIINATPDSFYDGGKWHHEKELLQHAEKMLREGALILDIGGMSSRPGASDVTEEEELNRVVPVISSLHKNFPHTILSVDTWRSRVLKEAVEAGAGMVNDITGGAKDAALWKTIAQLKLPYVLMHMQGDPATMQLNPVYHHAVREIFDWFKERILQLNALGIFDIILDPGFGFGKTIRHNFQLLDQLSIFQLFGLPILAGVSRKSMICKPLNLKPGQALNGTTVLNTIALLNGASILRVHDVKEAQEAINLIKELHAAVD